MGCGSTETGYAGNDALEMRSDPTKLVTDGKEALELLKRGNQRYLL